jgi:hypothetical protein
MKVHLGVQVPVEVPVHKHRGAATETLGCVRRHVSGAGAPSAGPQAVHLAVRLLLPVLEEPDHLVLVGRPVEAEPSAQGPSAVTLLAHGQGGMKTCSPVERLQTW